MTPTYLLTWNPREFPWDDIESDARQAIEGYDEPFTWSCGNTKRIRPGDRLFLIRLGVEPRGIVAAGRAVSAPFDEPHWDDERAERGLTARYIEARFDRILVPPLDDPLPMAILKTGELASVNWSTQSSGIAIKTGVAELERLWRRHLDSYDADNGDGLAAVEGGVTLALRRHRARERWLRDAKLADYKKKHDGRLPCEACGFDFFAVYGEAGRDYAQVHHLKPLGEQASPSLTKLDDLAVICANCHAMVHRCKTSLPLNGLLAK